MWLVVLALGLTGCASIRAYETKRWQDLADEATTRLGVDAVDVELVSGSRARLVSPAGCSRTSSAIT